MTKRLLAFLLSALLVFSCSAPVFAEGESQMSQEEASAKVAELQARITEVNNQVNEYNAQIADLEGKIAEAQEHLDQAEAQRAQQEDELKQRMRAIYMYGNDGYLEMMFSAQSLTELITYFDLSRNIMEADKNMQNQLINTKNVISESKKQLEDSKNEVEAKKAESEQAQEQLANELKENQDLLEELSLEGDYSGQGAVTAATNAQEVVQSVTSSGWTWPVDANARNAFLITSLMGTRESPGGIGSTDHGGTDIGCEYGATIVAVQSGTVTLAGGYGGYGNAVMIQNTDGYVTLYGHLSQIYVSEGQTVSPGQAIGACGSTGNSTGPHLHFEVRSGDSKVNGLSFYGNDILSRLTYATDA